MILYSKNNKGFSPLKNIINKMNSTVLNILCFGAGPKPAFNSSRGFTLIEMIIVIVIMGIMAVMGHAIFKTPNLKIACKFIFSHMQLEKMRAVSTNNNTYINLNSVDSDPNDADGDYLFNSLEDVDIPNEVNYPSVAPTSIPSYAFVTDGRDFDETGTPNILQFTPKGTPSGTGGSVYLKDMDSNKHCAVTVSPAGSIKLWTSSDGSTWE